MSRVDEIVGEVKRLAPADQIRLMRELAGIVLSERLAQVGKGAAVPLPLTDDEIDQLVHGARREALRASGL